MKTPADVRALATKRFQRERLNALREALGCAVTTTWPWVVPLGRPTERDVLTDARSVLAWRDAWVDAKVLGDFEVETDVIAWRAIGTQTVPVRVLFVNTKAIAKVAGLLPLWTQVVTRAKRFVALWPGIEEAMVREWAMLADWSDDAVLALERVLTWFVDHPKSGLYLRQLPIEGVDTKWFTEPRKKVVQRLLVAIREAKESVPLMAESSEALDPDTTFETVCGLKPLPKLIRGRLLDEVDQKVFYGLSDLSLPLDEWAQLPLYPEIVFISENLQTGLAFEAHPKSVVFFGLGAGVTQLAAIPWVRTARIIYWGDVDTYGLEILAHLRSVLPQTESVMMNRQTLEAFRGLAVAENRQASGAHVEHLRENEREVFDALKVGDLARLRLEQERIPWPVARETLLAVARFQAR
ncbi:MAG: hypothetical protein KHX35_08105 [Sutterella wadsworthensis]|nr:hypothetical protein [Sutterella wadsworthensis]